ncbi:MAG: peptide chain release factor N(5)-glutamine methyltransferase, partial [Pseudomonadota bacterium]
MRYLDHIRAGAQILRNAAVEDPGRDARRLMAAAAGFDAAQLIAEELEFASADHVDRYNGMIQRRAAREPVSRILGRREFWGLDFDISPDVLDPRPDTETLVEAALDKLATDRAATVWDMGTGSGCILTSILYERPAMYGVGVDVSSAALEIARMNASRLGAAPRMDFVCSHWFEDIEGRADLIVSNPPYIRDEDIGDLDPEVRGFDPELALKGGADGLAPYSFLAAGALEHLVPGGWLIVEVGAGQAADVMQIFAEA